MKIDVGKTVITVAGLALVSWQASAVTASPGAYRTLSSWPTGFSRGRFIMSSKDRPLCEAVAVAANRTYEGRPFDLDSDQMPTDGRLKFVDWKVIKPADSLKIATRILVSSWNASYPKGLSTERAELAKLSGAMASGAVWLESASVQNFLNKDVTRFIRLHRKSHDEAFQSFYIVTQLAIADGEGLGQLHALTGLEEAQDVFSHQGRSYLFGLSLRYNDNSGKVLEPPQPLINVFQPTNGGYAEVCKVIFQPSKQQ